MVRGGERAGQVVRFWRTIEMFSPQGIPPVTSEPDAVYRVLDVQADELAPWEQGHPIRKERLREGKAWQFTVYGGLYDVMDAQAVLVGAFGQDSKPPDARGGSRTAMFAFVLDADGQLVRNSSTLSSCAWAISRLRSPGPGCSTWLDGFEDDESAFIEALNGLVPPKVGTRTAESRVGRAIEDHVRAAAVEAAAAGAKEVGVVVRAVAGAVGGGIVGAVAGAFVERMLMPGAGTGDGRGASGNPDAGSAPVWPLRRRMTARALHWFVAELVRALDVESALRPAGVRVVCTQVEQRDDDEEVVQTSEQTFLNSFIVNDLAKVEQAVRDGDLGAGLRAYLSDDRDLRTEGRVDVREAREVLVSGVAPNRIPGGCWPTAVSKPLVISQQFAVNQIMTELGGDPGIFAVNGPPGTGKTTMLRDVLAAIVVERARKFAVLSCPTDAFTDVIERVRLTDRYTAPVRGVRPDLTGFEIVVATASNDAAANVTAEIPSIEAVRGAEQAALAANYFPKLASHVLGAPAWGMVAAVLGNMKNRATFGHRFWFGSGPTADNRSGAGRGGPEAPQREQTRLGMLEILKRVRDDSTLVPDWKQAVAVFREAEAQVRRLAAARQQVADAIAELPRVRATIRDCEQRTQQAHAVRTDLGEQLSVTRDMCEQWQAALDRAGAEYDRHVARRPGFWVALSTFFRASREWYTESVALARRRTDITQRLDGAAELMRRIELDLATHEQECRRRDDVLDEHRRRCAEITARIDAARRRWPGTVPCSDTTDEAFQLRAPWADQEFTEARNRLFLAALSLHRAFLLNAERPARGNLAVITAVLRGSVRLEPEAQLAAWQSLFLVVPMISTTFASLPRLFGDLESESIGWLFIDEAGQATPQQAVGGLWRARRTVIVGDPQQLEPIVTLPSSAQEAILDYYRVHEQWTPDITSVQRIADRLARHGTALDEPDGEGTVWVGAPLRVHRRCDRPIFDISNTIAYGRDLMVYGTADRDEFPGRNTWLDVVSGQSQGNWVPAEGRVLVALLEELIAQGVQAEYIRVISPFRDVVRGCAAVVRQRFDKQFPEKNIGTVHTVQGRESEVIVLVLGSAPGNVRGRRWAAAKPNLLNVAASRAKRRLYVIGNRNNWKNLRYFSVLAASLETSGPYSRPVGGVG